MIRIELMTHDLVVLINNLRDEAQKTEFDRDLKGELHLCQKKIEETEQELKEMDAMIDSSKISIKCSEKQDVLKRISELVIQFNIQFGVLNVIRLCVDESGFCFDDSRDIAYKVNEIIEKCKHMEYQGEKIVTFEKCIREALKHLDNNDMDKAVTALRKRGIVTTEKCNTKKYILDLVNDFNKMNANMIDMGCFEIFLEEKLCK